MSFQPEPSPAAHTATSASSPKPVTGHTLQKMRHENEKIAMLTCYDASFASAMDAAGVDALLVGDSLGMVCQGHSSTLPVTLQDMAYHTAAVARGTKRAMVIADLPFGSYGTPEKALGSAIVLMQAGAQMVKLEGGHWLLQTVHMLVERGIPVCGHLGLTPQSVNTLGGYRVQGKEKTDANKLTEDAIALQHAGATLFVLEAIPATLGTSITESISVPTIGIGAGIHCSGQVLVMHDMLGVYPGHRPKFVRNFMDGQTSLHNAIKSYVTCVKDGSFPSIDHIF